MVCCEGILLEIPIDRNVDCNVQKEKQPAPDKRGALLCYQKFCKNIILFSICMIISIFRLLVSCTIDSGTDSKGMEEKMQKKKYFFIRFMFLFVILAGNLLMPGTAQAERIGSGARIILYDEPEQARFHLGGVVGFSQKVTAEPTGEKQLTDIEFSTSNPSVCSLTREEDYWELHRLAEGTSVIRMTCKADGNEVVRTLLVSSYIEVGTEDEPVMGRINSGTMVYYGCTDQEGITSASTEIKTTTEKEMEAVVAYRCLDYYRVELEEETFGDSGEEWGYVKKSQVRIPVTSISGKKNAVFFEGETISLDTSVRPLEATDSRVQYQISNTNVATVSADGKVTGIHAGEAVVTATSVENPQLIYKCEITVKPYIPVTGIEVNPHQIEMEDGMSGRITVRILPSDASVPDFSWKVSGEDVVRIDSKGRYRAMKPGKATVTAISKEGNFTDSCEITVRPVLATGVHIQSSMDIDVGEIKSPVWRMIPENATNKSATWTSEDPSIATVDKQGRITGVKTGTTRVQIKTREGGFTAVCQVTVHIYVKDIRLKSNTITLTQGDTKTLKPIITPQNTTKQKIIWNSKNKAVVRVTGTGEVKALKAGKAEVIVYDRYTGAYDFCMIEVKAGLAKPRLEGKKSKKKYQLSWKKVQRATNYVVYQYKKKNRKFIRVTTLGSGARNYRISKPRKGSRYKIRTYYAPTKEYSKYSRQVKIK